MFLRDESNNNVIKYKIENFEEIDDLSIQMQQLNNIKGLLTFGRTNNTFLFATSELIPISEFVQNTSDINKTEFLESLNKQITETINSVNNYMIPKEQLIVNFEFSYLDKEGNLFLPCVPTDWAYLESRTAEEFSAMVLKKLLEKSGTETENKEKEKRNKKKDKSKEKKEKLKENKRKLPKDSETIEKEPKTKKAKEVKPKKELRLLERLKEGFGSGDGDDVFDFPEDDNLPEGVSVIAVRKTGDEYPLLFGPDIIGSDESKCSICFADNETMSAEHCSITLSKGRYFIADLNSKSGTLLNGQHLEPGKTYELSSADLITIAGEEMVFSRRI